MTRRIKVVAAIIENDQNEILCALRSPNMSLPDVWEFPGGKVETDEDPYVAIKREIHEELGCEIEAKHLFHENFHSYGDFDIHLLCICCKIIKGSPVAKEHDNLKWMKLDKLLSLTWAPADIPAVKKLQMHRSCKD